MNKSNDILQIAIDTPLAKSFDYRCPTHWAIESLSPGVRVQVPFGNRVTIGMLTGLAQHSPIPQQRLKDALMLIDNEPVFDPALYKVLKWAADYYHHPIGEVMATALPVYLRDGRPAFEARAYWKLTPDGEAGNLNQIPANAIRVRKLFEELQRAQGECDDDYLKEQLASDMPGWRDAMKSLDRRGWVERHSEIIRAVDINCSVKQGVELNRKQKEAAQTLIAALGSFGSYLLHGITGSGKTEVYLAVIAEAIARGQQALVLVPEIGLTPQLLDRFASRIDAPLAVMHSAMSDGDRLRAWQMAASGQAPVVIGTRSAVFSRMRRPGVIIVDEEHDTSYKQQDGFRYSARDLAVARAREYGIPVVLGSATPSLESIGNVETGRYTRIVLPERPGIAQHPDVRLIDLRMHESRDGLSTPLVLAIKRHLDSDGQVLLYLNRRGYAPALFCHACGWVAVCERCDARMTVHHKISRLRCHHCGKDTPLATACSDCNEELKPVGQGTQRIEQTLGALLPGVQIARIDRDSIRKRGDLDRVIAAIRSGQTRVLVGTQMLTKGHDFPNVTLVGVLNADQGLFGTDFRASERLAQSIVQVSGRAGRDRKPGEVLIQTEFPDHPLLNKLICDGYDAFADAAMDERRQSGWPPYSRLALLRAEASKQGLALEFLNHVAALTSDLAPAGVTVLGPAPAPMEKRGGRYRAQLLVQATRRHALHQFLTAILPKVSSHRDSRKVRWSLDVDPVELF